MNISHLKTSSPRLLSGPRLSDGKSLLFALLLGGSLSGSGLAHAQTPPAETSPTEARGAPKTPAPSSSPAVETSPKKVVPVPPTSGDTSATRAEKTRPAAGADGGAAEGEAAPEDAEAPPEKPQNPHGFVQGPPPSDQSFPDPTLPVGEVHVRVVGPNEEPIAGAKVTLLTHFQSVAKGDNKSTQSSLTGADGVAVFRKLETALRFSYGVSVTREGATYELPAFRLEKSGHRAVVHTYPVTSDPKQAFVGMQGYVTARVKEDLFRVDTVYRVINMSRTTWRPNPIRIELPRNAQGLEAEITAGDAGFRQVEGGLELVGSFPPGQKDLPFAFHVPNENEESQTIEMSVPPHLVDMNVLTESSPGMTLSVSPGFPGAEERMGRDEKKVLLTRRVMRPGEGQLERVVIQLGGLPVIGPGRWIAVGASALIAGLGLFTALFRKEEEDETEKKEEQERARATLLDEMLLLKRAFDEGTIGPKTFEQTKREILTALARLEPMSDDA